MVQHSLPKSSKAKKKPLPPGEERKKERKKCTSKKPRPEPDLIEIAQDPERYPQTPRREMPANTDAHGHALHSKCNRSKPPRAWFRTKLKRKEHLVTITSHSLLFR